jgi:hypothetical protein
VFRKASSCSPKPSATSSIMLSKNIGPGRLSLY